MDARACTLTRPERLVLAVRARRFLRLDSRPAPTPWPEVAAWLQRVEPGHAWTEDAARTVVSRVHERMRRGGNADPAAGESMADGSYESDSRFVGLLLTSGAIGPVDLRLLTW